MKKKNKKRSGGRGALLAIAALFLISGLIRFADGTGSAIAKEVEALSQAEHRPSQAVRSTNQGGECVTEDGINQTVAQLRDRHNRLDDKEKKIAARMNELRNAEHSLRENLKAVEQAEKELAATIALADGAAERDIETLIAVYEKMKPKDVSKVFEAMDPGFASGFLGKMRADTAASVMAGLSPEKAYTISILLAGRNMDAPKY